MSVMADKMRTFLTTLGIMIGVCAVVIMVSAGQAIQLYIDETFESMGGSLLLIVPGVGRSKGIRTAQGRYTVSRDDVESLKDIKDVTAVAGMISTSRQMVYGPINWYARIMGTSPDYLIVGNWEIDRGTMFTDKDIKSASSVVVLGQTVVDELFGMDDPIGKYIRIRNLPFRVIGTLKSKGQGMGGEDQDNIVLSPLTTVRQRLKGSRRPQMVDVAFVKVEDESKISAVQQRVTYRLRARHNLKDTQEDDFEVRDMTEIVNKVRSVGRALSILLALIASISLLVGSIGIMNMMLVSVTERTREIGTRKALGASNKWIMFQFLVESVLISFLGSFVGLVFGIALSQIGGAVMEATVPVSLWAVAVSASVAVVVGIASGGYPAYKAMKLDPIEALRYQ